MMQTPPESTSKVTVNSAPLRSLPAGDTIAASTATTSTVAVGGAATGYINTLGDHDWFAVDLVAGQSYAFTLNATVVGLDPYLRFRNSAGVLLAENDDSGSLNSRITFTATTTGRYYLDAGAYNDNSSGSYTLGATTFVPLPVYTNDQIATFLTTGYWGGAVSHWAPGSTVTYNVQGLLPGAQALARAAFSAWQDVANLNFVETVAAGSITLDDNQAGAFASFSSTGGVTTSAIVNVQPNWSGEANPGLDSYTFQTFIHEIGHTLGLGHGGPYNGSGSYGVDNIYQNDTWAATVMSYFPQGNYNGASTRFVMSAMMADIIAVQGIYGANTTTRTGDTVYGHNATAGTVFNFSTYTTAPSFTIWDAGGLDTLDASGYSAVQNITLASESTSSIGGLQQNIHIARGVVIENARGGSGADTINGNAVANIIFGNGGIDYIFGGDGNDTLNGGAGDDTLDGGLQALIGADTADYGAATSNVTVWLTYNRATGGADVGTDSLIGIENVILGSGNDTALADAIANSISGGAGNDGFLGYEGNDTLDGGDGNDLIFGQEGNDSLLGGAGDDIVAAGVGYDSVGAGDGIDFVLAEDGNDSVSGGNDRDLLYGQAGNDTLNGDGGDDFLAAGDDDDVMNGGTGLDVLFGEAGNDTGFGNDDRDWLYGFAGNDTLYGGAGDDVLGGSDGLDVLHGEEGADAIFGEANNDTIVAGNGFDYVVGGAGVNTISLGGGLDIVQSSASDGGQQMVSDFGIADFDQIWLVGSGYATTAAALAAAQQFGANVVIQNGTDQVVLENITVGQLNTYNFVLF